MINKNVFSAEQLESDHAKIGMHSGYVFMLNGNHSQEYHYTNDEYNLINDVFHIASSLKGIDSSAACATLFFVLKDFMGVESYASLLTEPSSGFSFDNMSSEIFNYNYIPDSVRETAIDTYNCYKYNGKYYVILWKMIGPNIGSESHLITMNLDIASSLSALHKIKSIGVEKLIYLYLFIHSTPDVALITYFNDKPKYLSAAKTAIKNNDTASISTLFEFIYYNMFVRFGEINAPNYSFLKRLSKTPAPILRTNLESGDYDKRFSIKRQHFMDLLSEDDIETRKYMLRAVTSMDYFNYDSDDSTSCGNLSGFSFYREKRIFDLALRLMSPEYAANWHMLDNATKELNPWTNKPEYARDIFYLLPWRPAGLYYDSRATIGLLSTIIPYEDRTRRLYALLASRDLFKKLWINCCGNGYGSLPNNDHVSRFQRGLWKGYNHVHFVKNLVSKPMIPRRLWGIDGAEHDLRTGFIKPDRTFNECKFPHEFMNYIVNGELPETITCDNYWRTNSVFYTKTSKGYDIADTRNIRTKMFFNPDDNNNSIIIMFKLKTGEPSIDDLWNEWADSLSSY